MFCKYCGKTVDNDAQFCSFCGKRIGAANPPAPAPASAQPASSTVPGTASPNSNILQTIVFNDTHSSLVTRTPCVLGQFVNAGDVVVSVYNSARKPHRTHIQYYAAQNGYISRICVSPGQTVHNGQLMAEISSTPIAVPTPQTVPMQKPTPPPAPTPVVTPAPKSAAAPAPKAPAQPVASPTPSQSAAVKTGKTNQQSKENVLMGTLGAVLSAAAVGLVLAYLTYHGAFGTQFGILLPCLAILSYQKFGNKISFFSILLAVALTAVTPYLAHRAAWAWALKEGGWVTSIFEAFKMVPEYIGTAIPRTDYKSSLQDLYLFCILGIVLPLLGILWSLIKALFASIFKK